MTDVDFLLKALELKDETRTGWAVRGVENPESVAAHSWGAAFLTFLFAAEAGIDREDAVAMALLHDVHESVSGDIMSGGLTEAEQAEKNEAEEAGFQELLALRDRDAGDLEELWQEYESRETATARFVKDMDRVKTALQAYYYRVSERYSDEETFFKEWDGMDEFFSGTRDLLHTDTARQVFDAIHARYEEMDR
ncbi:MAG: HD domain-containing protein [Candidatus Nanohaloarchaea archaeon]